MESDTMDMSWSPSAPYQHARPKAPGPFSKHRHHSKMSDRVCEVRTSSEAVAFAGWHSLACGGHTHELN